MSLFKKARDGIVSGIGMAYESAEHSVLGTLSRRHPDIDEIFNIIDGIKEEQVNTLLLKLVKMNNKYLYTFYLKFFPNTNCSKKEVFLR